jgi:galactose oxidase-like protein
MKRIRHGSLRAALFPILILLLSALLLPSPAIAKPTPGAKPPAAHWAGDADGLTALPTRVDRAGGPGALSGMRAGGRPAFESFARPALTPSAGGDDGTWSLLAGTGTFDSFGGPGRVTHSAIYDPTRDRVVLFGGGGSQYLNDTWVLPSGATEWVQLETQGDPPAPRRLQTSIYDAQHDRMIVFGGFDGGFYNDVWALTFQGSTATWSQLTPAGDAPAARAGHVAVYDANDHRMIVFGGYDGVSEPALRRSDVWALSLDGTPAWSDITPAGDGPSARSSAAAVYDSQRDRMIVVGGTDPSFLNDAWALDLGGAASWSAIDAATPPPAREEQSLVYDAANDRLIEFGGYDAEYLYGDAWSLSLAGPPAWSELQPSGLGPGPRWGHIAVAAASHMVVFGGYTGCGLQSQTYFLNLNGSPAWSNPTTSPGSGPLRHTFASALDTRRHRLLLFGGSTVTNYQNDTWVINLDDHPLWSALATQGTPPSPRRLAEAVYDREGDRLIVYGGYDGTILGDLWQLDFATDPPTWSPLAATGEAPHARAGHAMVYDPSGNRVIVFGGYDGVSENYRRNDLWALGLGDSPSWEPLSAEGTPPSPRSSPSAVYDSRRHQMLLFGGTAPGFTNETWALSLDGSPTWTQLLPSGPLPTPREEQSGMYDQVRDRLLIFGGYYDPFFDSMHDTWALALGDSPAWTQLSPGGPQPPVRWGHAAVYDVSRDRMILHGGLGPGLDQTWALTWGQPEAGIPTLIDSQADAGQVSLIWAVNGGSYFSASVYRSVNGGAWSAVDDVPVDAAGQAAYQDHAVAPGTHYGYRVGVQSGAGEKVSDATYVDTPGTTGVGDAPRVLAILGSQPRGTELSVRISLASDAAARLALLDVGGRTIAVRDLGGLGAGGHQVSLAGGAGIAPGVYWLRLTQGAHMASAKTAVWR